MKTRFVIGVILSFVVLLAAFFCFGYSLLPPVEGLPILMYHTISEGINDRLNVSVERFEEQLAFMRYRGYTPITFSDLSKHVRDQKLLLEKPVLLTFDDGHESVYRLAYPLLKKYGFKATAFLTTHHIKELNGGDATEILDYATIRKLSRDDVVEFGLHSHRHENYRFYSASQVELDLRQCIAALEQHQCPFASVFAYPYGGVPTNEETMRAVKRIFQQHEIEFALRIGNRVNTFPLRDFYKLTRIEIDGTDSIQEFETKLKRGRSKPF